MKLFKVMIYVVESTTTYNVIANSESDVKDWIKNNFGSTSHYIQEQLVHVLHKE